jgi:hypothetical protein
LTRPPLAGFDPSTEDKEIEERRAFAAARRFELPAHGFDVRRIAVLCLLLEIANHREVIQHLA